MAVSGVPTCGCPEDRLSAPGSSTFVTVTVTASASLFSPSEARTVTAYALFRPPSTGSSKSGAVLKLSRPFEALNSNLSPSAPPSACQAIVAFSGSVARYVPTSSVPSSSRLGDASPLTDGASFTSVTTMVTVTVSSMTVSGSPLSSSMSLTETVTE